MKIKNIITFLILGAAWTSSLAQSANDVFNPDVPLIWLGWDFTGARFIGDREKLGSESDMRSLIAAWNDLMVKEKEKYDVGLMLDKKQVIDNLEITKAHNAELDVSEIYTDKAADHIHLRKESISEIVAGYDFEKLSGLGLMFNIETFNKTNMEALVWVTFVDLRTKKVVFTEKMSASPGGFGIKNFWAGAVYGIMKDIKKKEFEMWRKKYQRQ